MLKDKWEEFEARQDLIRNRLIPTYLSHKVAELWPTANISHNYTSGIHIRLSEWKVWNIEDEKDLISGLDELMVRIFEDYKKWIMNLNGEVFESKHKMEHYNFMVVYQSWKRDKKLNELGI